MYTINQLPNYSAKILRTKNLLPHFLIFNRKIWTAYSRMKGSEFARTTVPVNVHMLSHLWMGKEPGQVPYALFTPPWQSDSGLTRFGIDIYTGSMHPPKRVPYTQLSKYHMYLTEINGLLKKHVDTNMLASPTQNSTFECWCHWNLKIRVSEKKSKTPKNTTIILDYLSVYINLNAQTCLNSFWNSHQKRNR